MDNTAKVLELNRNNLFDEIIPITDAKYLDYPINAFEGVEWIKNYVEELAIQTQVDVAMTTSVLFALMGTCLQNKFIVETTKQFKVPLMAFTMLIAESGERKSTVMSPFLKLITNYQIKYNNDNRTKIEQNKAEFKLLNKQIEELEKTISKGNFKTKEGSSFKSPIELEQYLKNKLKTLIDERTEFVHLREKKLYCDDVTQEKMGVIMAENEGSTSIYSAEGGIANKWSGKKYNGNCADIDIVNKAYSGETITVDRLGRESFNIPHTALSIGLALQSNVLSNFISNEEFKKQGLTARFIYTYPKSSIGYRSFKSENIKEITQIKFNKNIEKLLKLPYPEHKDIATLRYTQDAEKIAEELFDWTEKKNKKKEFEYMQEWFNRYNEHVHKIAGFLHIAKHIDCLGENASNPFVTEIDADTIKQAIVLGKYYLNTAINIFKDGSDSGTYSNCKYLISKLKELKITEITKTELGGKCRKLNREEINEALSILEEHNYIMKVEEKATTKTKILIKVNPDIK